MGKKTILTTYPALPVPKSFDFDRSRLCTVEVWECDLAQVEKSKWCAHKNHHMQFLLDWRNMLNGSLFEKIEWWSCDTKQAAKRYAVIPYKWINPVQLIVGRTECSPIKVVNFDSFWPKYCQTRSNDINVFRVTRLQESLWCRHQEGEILF